MVLVALEYLDLYQKCSIFLMLQVAIQYLSHEK